VLHQAAQSHEFNLKNATFCELFPDLAEKSRKTIEMQKAINAQKLSGSNGSASTNGDPRAAARQTLERNQGHGIQGAVTNFLVSILLNFFLRHCRKNELKKVPVRGNNCG
jgi:hypothetical protein